MAAAAAKLVSLLLMVIMRMKAVDCQEIVGGGRGSWCVARSDASSQALQTALDYACGAGADCIPIQSDGLCFLPNTIQAHASYAFNSFYQRKARAPGSCDFAGTSTIAQTDPSMILSHLLYKFIRIYILILSKICYSSFSILYIYILSFLLHLIDFFFLLLCF